jgi:hypothetical protein
MIPRHMDRRLSVLDFVDVFVVALWFFSSRMSPLLFSLGLR